MDFSAPISHSISPPDGERQTILFAVFEKAARGTRNARKNVMTFFKGYATI